MASQDQSQQSSSNNPSTTSIKSDLNNQLALATDKAAGKTASDTKSDAATEASIAEPKVSMKIPSLEFKVRPAESKMKINEIEVPGLDDLGEPQSFQATAYALYGHTRSGTYVRRGIVAADPRVIPLGSVVHIKSPGYSGVYTVRDTGKKIKGNIVDVWVPSTREARIFGRRQIKLHVLRLGPVKRSKK
jgi:3D (Asp-Asp-Asp) domain-containing protein